jgi:1,4-alpha-glucan branching enzyme
LSHDEVVHGKRSLLDKMPGDMWQKFANLRLLYGFMFGHPGKKLLFMGGDFGQWDEWYYAKSLDWHLLEYDTHRGIQQFIKDLNQLYKSQPALYENDFHRSGFEWIDFQDLDNSAIAFLRRGRRSEETLIFVCNFTPVVRENYRIGVPQPGYYAELLNSDSKLYGGSGVGNLGGIVAENRPWHNHRYSLNLALPPLAVLVFKRKT